MPTPLPFAWPFALLFWSIFVWVFLPEYRIVSRAQRMPRPTEDRGSLQVVLHSFNVAILGAFALALLIRSAVLPGSRYVWFCFGLVALVLGSLLRRHCFRVLGTFFTGAVTIQEGHQIIDSGAYRWLRHPSYSAALLIVLGTTLALGNWLSVVFAVVITFLAYSYRARVEEQALLALFGPAYAQFMATRKRFVPFIY